MVNNPGTEADISRAAKVIPPLEASSRNSHHRAVAGERGPFGKNMRFHEKRTGWSSSNWWETMPAYGRLSSAQCLIFNANDS